jgi:phasin family protein
MRDYSLKMIDMAKANTEAVFEFARQLASAKAPSDLATVWTTHARKQFEMLSEQSRELAALGQKMTGESAAPLARNVKQAFDKAS